MLFSLCPLCSLWFSKTHFQKIIKNVHDLLRSAYTVDEKVVFRTVAIPAEVKIEVVDRGKEEGAADAFLIESEIADGWIVIEEIDTSDSVKEIAKSVGIEIGETAAIMLARRKNCPILLDDLAARRFATGLGLEVAGSIGVLIRSAKIRKPFEDRGTGCAGAACTGDVAQCRCL